MTDDFFRSRLEDRAGAKYLPYFVYDSIFRNDFIYTSEEAVKANINKQANLFYTKINSFYNFPFETPPHDETVGIYVIESPFNITNSYLIGYMFKTGVATTTTVVVILTKQTLIDFNMTLENAIKNIWYLSIINIYYTGNNTSQYETNENKQYNNKYNNLLFRNYKIFNEAKSTTTGPEISFDVDIDKLKSAISAINPKCSIININDFDVTCKDSSGKSIIVGKPIINNSRLTMQIGDRLLDVPIKKIEATELTTPNNKASIPAISGYDTRSRKIFDVMKNHEENEKKEKNKKIFSNPLNQSFFRNNFIHKIVTDVLQGKTPKKSNNGDIEEIKLILTPTISFPNNFHFPFSLENIGPISDDSYYISLNNIHEIRYNRLKNVWNTVTKSFGKNKLAYSIGIPSTLGLVSTETYQNMISKFCETHPYWSAIIEPILKNPKTSMMVIPALIAFGYPQIAKTLRQWWWNNWYSEKPMPAPAIN